MSSGLDPQRFPKVIGRSMNMSACPAFLKAWSRLTSWTSVPCRVPSWCVRECRLFVRPIEFLLPILTIQVQITLWAGNGGGEHMKLILLWRHMSPRSFAMRPRFWRRLEKQERNSRTAVETLVENPKTRAEAAMANDAQGPIAWGGAGWWDSGFRRPWSTFSGWPQFWWWCYLRPERSQTFFFLGRNSGVGFSSAWNRSLARAFSSLPPEALTGRSHSESSRRRRAKVRSRVEESNSIMECLNEMYGPPVPKGHCLPMTEAQHVSHHAIFKQLARLKRPQTRCKMREAIQELLHTPISYSGDENMSTVRPYERCLVSLPECGSAPVPLHEVLDAEGRDLLEGSFDSMLLDDEEWGEVIEHETPIKPYMDTTLQNDPIKYGQFVKDLWEKGMLRFTSEPKDLVTPFFVVKKNGKLRFILDCRGVNKRFRPPPALALAAGSSWSQVSIPKGSKMFVAQSDIKDYFYSLELPHALQPLFCLPPLPSSVVQEWSSTLQGLPSSPSGWVWPMLQVLPMGWSWAMYFAQRVHQHLCLEATGLSMSQVLVEGRPAPDMSKEGVVLIPYADNLNVAGLNQNEVQHVKDTVVKHLRDKGFRVHEETEASTTAVSLGFLIDGEHGVICPIPERLDRVLSAFTWLSMEPRVSGKAVERVIGHAVHFCMLRRELLSIFRSLYDFIQHSYWHRTKLWPSAAREARWASHLLKLCSADLTREWSSDTTASDASLSGVAVCRRSMSEADQVRYGTRKEIWRYKYNLPVKPRDSAIGRPDPFTDIRTVKPIDHKSADPFVLDADFPEVDASLLKQEDWHDVFSVHMVIPEHITLLEGRGVVAALRHKLRSKHEFFKRHLHFNDNMGVVLLCSKGRSNSYPMLRVARRIACLCLAADISLSVRWIPSELNIADKASRRWEKQRIANASCGTTKCERPPFPKRSPEWIDRGNEWKADLSGDNRSREEEEEDGKQMSSSQNSSWENSVQGRCEEAKNRPSSFSGADYSGKTGSVNSRGGGLQQENGGAEEVRKDAQASHDQEELGRGLLQVCEQFVRSRVRPPRRKQNPCSSYRQPPRLFPSTHAAAHMLCRVGQRWSLSSLDLHCRGPWWQVWQWQCWNSSECTQD